MPDNNFWLKVWENNDIPFHQDDVKSELIDFFPLLNLQKNSNILIPLCGKSKDLLWLSEQGHQIIGIEISPIACENFFTENNIQPSVIKKPSYLIYQNDNIRIICADLFQLTKDDFPTIHAIYDCKALIALPPEMKKKYVQHLLQCVGPEIQILLFNILTDDKVQGPPFPSSDAEIEMLYSDFQISKIKEECHVDLQDHLIKKGYQKIYESVFLMKR